MKKIKLLRSYVEESNETMTRSQLKNVLGGSIPLASSCFTCYSLTDNQQVANYGSCATTNENCKAGTCRDYSC